MNTTFSNARKRIKADELIKTAAEMLGEAADLIADTREYQTKSDIFHAETVHAYNRISTVILILKEYKNNDLY